MQNSQNLRQSLRQTLGGLVYQRLDVIEGQIALGVYQEAICEDLAKELGRPISLQSFRKSLWRARNRRDGLHGHGSRQSTPKPVGVPGGRLSAEELLELQRMEQLRDAPPAQVTGAVAAAGLVLTEEEIREVVALVEKIVQRRNTVRRT